MTLNLTTIPVRSKPKALRTTYYVRQSQVTNQSRLIIPANNKYIMATHGEDGYVTLLSSQLTNAKTYYFSITGSEEQYFLTPDKKMFITNTSGKETRVSKVSINNDMSFNKYGTAPSASASFTFTGTDAASFSPFSLRGYDAANDILVFYGNYFAGVTSQPLIVGISGDLSTVVYSQYMNSVSSSYPSYGFACGAKNGHHYVGGLRYTSTGLSRSFFVKYNSSGVRQWDRELKSTSTGSGFSGIRSIAVKSDGTLITAGYHTYSGSSAIDVLSFASNGNPGWNKRITLPGGANGESQLFLSNDETKVHVFFKDNTNTPKTLYRVTLNTSDGTWNSGQYYEYDLTHYTSAINYEEDTSGEEYLTMGDIILKIPANGTTLIPSSGTGGTITVNSYDGSSTVGNMSDLTITTSPGYTYGSNSITLTSPVAIPTYFSPAETTNKVVGTYR